ncbi:MAG TPA: RHS repeat-associated core domain-containing protein, partial [Spirochaetota bacterium]|nr:RHS repeat-associated core domain-containing protein [Spirochaetota bacterium]
NRLIKTTDSLHTTDYRYDANGERIIKKSELGETQYVSANYIVRNKTVISKHVFAGNQRIASTVSMKNNCGTMTEQNTMYFHPDHLGSSSYVTDKKGNFFEMIEYLPYGETLYDEAATVDKTEFRFTSKEQDAETGLYYYGARYYDARTSRFVSADDRFDDLFSSQGLDIFAYCHNNPINYIDPSGHDYEDAKGYTRYGDKGNDTPKKGQEGSWSPQKTGVVQQKMKDADIEKLAVSLGQTSEKGVLGEGPIADKLEKAIPKIDGIMSYFLDKNDMASSACFSAAMYIALRSIGANVEPTYEDYYIKQVNKGNIRASDAYLSRWDLIVADYTVNGQKIIYKISFNQQDILNSNVPVGIMYVTGHFSCVYTDGSGSKRMADTGWSGNVGMGASIYASTRNFKQFIYFEYK